MAGHLGILVWIFSDRRGGEDLAILHHLHPLYCQHHTRIKITAPATLAHQGRTSPQKMRALRAGHVPKPLILIHVLLLIRILLLTTNPEPLKLILIRVLTANPEHPNRFERRARSTLNPKSLNPKTLKPHHTNTHY